MSALRLVKPTPRPAPDSLAAVIDTYLNDCYTLAPGTRALYASHLARFLNTVGSQPVTNIDAATVREFMATLRRQDGDEYSPAYQDGVYRALHTFFAWLVREEIIEANPMAHVRRPRVPKRKSPRLTLEEIKRLLDAIRGTGQAVRNLAMICLMVGSGLRRNEVLQMRVEDVDLENEVVRVHGKGGKDRDVPIEDVTRQALTAYRLVRPLTRTTRLFVTAEGAPLTVNGLQSLVFRLKRTSGLPQLHCHLLRHTYANSFIAEDGSLRKLQKILGHASPETTAAIYTDPDLPELKAAHRRGSPLAHLSESHLK